MVRLQRDKGFGGYDRGGQPALHVAGPPAAIDFPVLKLAAKRVTGPAVADLHHIMVGVEMHAISGT